MKVYFAFDPRDGALCGSRVPRLDPEETRVQGKECYLLPGLLETEVQPPEPPEGYWPVWNGEGWEHVKDHRGEVWYRVEDGLMAVPIRITFLGDPSEKGLVREPPPVPPVPDTPTPPPLPPMTRNAAPAVVSDDEQIRYEIAMRARNGSAQALKLLEDEAAIVGKRARELAEDIIKEREDREARVAAAFADRARKAQGGNR